MKKTLLLISLIAASVAAFGQPQNLPFVEDFESSTLIPSGFTLINVDGNTPNDTDLASLADSAFIVRSSSFFGSNVALGVSYYDPLASANDWLILPQLNLSGNAVLSWKAMSLTSSGNYPDYYQVLISTTDAQPASFDTILTIEGEQWRESVGGEGIQNRSIRLDTLGYADEAVYIAFRLMTPDPPGGDRIAFDDIRVEELLVEGFEGADLPDTWTVINGGYSENTWIRDSYAPYDGVGHAAIDTWESDTSIVTDDWLITPAIQVAEGFMLSFWASSDDDTYWDNLIIQVSQTGTAVEDFTINVDSIDGVPNEYTKYSYDLTSIEEVDAGDTIHIGFYVSSEGYWLYLDEVRVGLEAPIMMKTAAATSDTSLMVWFDTELSETPHPDEFMLKGSASITFDTSMVDPDDAKVLHLLGSSTSMAGDTIIDTLMWTEQQDPVTLYGGIVSLAYTSLTNPEGTLMLKADGGGFATFKGIVMAVTPSERRVWVAEDAASHMGINTFDLNIDTAIIGDEILFYGKLDPYQNQSEIVDGALIEKLSTGNTPFDAITLTGADISIANNADEDPAEQYEGLLVKLERATIDSYQYDPDGGYFNCTQDDGTTFFYVRDRLALFNGSGDSLFLEVGKTYDLRGMLINRGGEYQLSPRNDDDILDVTIVEEKLRPAALKLYPNPAEDILQISGAADVQSIEIYTLLGQRIRNLRDISPTMQLNLEDLPRGQYILSATHKDGGKTNLKLMKH